MITRVMFNERKVEAHLTFSSEERLGCAQGGPSFLGTLGGSIKIISRYLEPVPFEPENFLNNA